jgi:hypothetical protein
VHLDTDEINLWHQRRDMGGGLSHPSPDLKDSWRRPAKGFLEVEY